MGRHRQQVVLATYGYDYADRLTTLSHDLSGTAADLSQSFTYNAAGQVKGVTGSNSSYTIAAPSIGSTSYAANGQNQLTSAGSASLSYDGRGNLSSDGTNSYGYDVANNLTSASGAGLTYDPAGRLLKTEGSATTQFLYDGQDMIAEYDGSGTLLRRYVHGPSDDEPIVWYEGTGTSTPKWLVADRLGTVVALTDSSGAATNTNTYDEYGAPTSGNAGRFGFTGQAWIPEAGLFHYKARAYSPTYGRFMQSDPIGYGDGLNFYAYVHGDPVNGWDYFGLDVTATGRRCDVGYQYVNSTGSDGHCEKLNLPNLRGGPFDGGAPLGGGGPGANPDCSSAASGLLPRGIGYFVGAEASLGTKSANDKAGGITGQVQGAIIGFSGDKGPSIGTEASGGYVNAWGRTGQSSSPGPSKFSSIIGAFAGLSEGITFTNARNAEQLSGPFTTATISLFFAGVSVSLSGSTYQVNVGVGPGVGTAITGIKTTAFHAKTQVGRC